MKHYNAIDAFIFVVLGILIAPVFILTNPYLPDTDPMRDGSPLTVILLLAGMGGGLLTAWKVDYRQISRHWAIARTLTIGLCIGTLVSGWSISTDSPANLGYIAMTCGVMYRIMDSVYGQKMRVVKKG